MFAISDQICSHHEQFQFSDLASLCHRQASRTLLKLCNPMASTIDKLPADFSNVPLTKASPPRGRSFNKVKPTDKPVKQAPEKSTPVRSSKPIINWFQRKLAGSGRAKRAENRRAASDAAALTKSRAASIPRAATRVVSSPVPSPSYARGRQQRTPDFVSPALRKAASLDGDSSHDFTVIEDCDANSLDQSSLALESTWSPNSVLEADDDASLRPLPPSPPPSPSPSRSSSSYLSDPRTFRSIAASTKPTTLLSIDMNGGMAHIAQAPLSSPANIYRFPPHIRTSSSANNPGVHGSGASISFSALPQSSSRPPSSITGSPTLLQTPSTGLSAISSIQAPLHTTYHPRNNPRPYSPPLDNASILTLASSAYAIPGFRPSGRGFGDSLSHGGSITYADAESTSQYILGDDEGLGERDVDASVRALRPRSSRRGSWESEASRWSARDQQGAGTPSLLRERSLRTATSIRTGVLSMENLETSSEIEKVDDNASSLHPSPTDPGVETVHPSQVSPKTNIDLIPPFEDEDGKPSIETVAQSFEAVSIVTSVPTAIQDHTSKLSQDMDNDDVADSPQH